MSKDKKFLQAIRYPEEYDVQDEEYIVMQMGYARQYQILEILSDLGAKFSMKSKGTKIKPRFNKHTK